MATVENVGVSMTLIDNISAPLKKICGLMDAIVEKVSAFSDSAKIAAKHTRLYANQLERVANAYGVITKSESKVVFLELSEQTKRVNRQARAAAGSVDRLNQKVYASVDASGKAVFGLNSLRNSLETIVLTYASMRSLKLGVEWSDELTLVQGKLAQLTDDVEGFMRKTYQMSQDTRTSYMDNASQMAKMWQLTGGINGVFDSEEKLLEFNELLNKSFILGGSGVREINASIYQLTQALSS